MALIFEDIKEQRLFTVLKNSRLSDTEMAERLRSSQPTITRTRNQLEKEGNIKSYTIVPDFVKLGYQILAFTFIKMKSYPSVEETGKTARLATEWVGKHHNIIFTALP